MINYKTIKSLLDSLLIIYMCFLGIYMIGQVLFH
jgi:hypothetical protein